MVTVYILCFRWRIGVVDKEMNKNRRPGDFLTDFSLIQLQKSFDNHTICTYFVAAGSTCWGYLVIVRSAITLTLEIKMDLISIRLQILHMGRHPYTVILQISTPHVHSECCLGGIFALGTFRVLTWLAFGGLGFIVFSTFLVALSSISIGAHISSSCA